MNHHRGFAPIYKACGEWLKGVDPSMNHYMGLTLIDTGCGEE